MTGLVFRGQVSSHPGNERRQLPTQGQQEEERPRHAIADIPAAPTATVFWGRLPFRPKRAALRAAPGSPSAAPKKQNQLPKERSGPLLLRPDGKLLLRP